MSFLLSFLLLLAPVKVEQGRFNIIKDGKKIGTDEFVITMHGANYVVDGKATVGSMTISSKMELNDKLIPISYEVSNHEGRIRVNVCGRIPPL